MIEMTQLSSELIKSRLSSKLRSMRVWAAGLLCVLATVAFAEPPPSMTWVKLSEIYYTTSQVRLYGANPGQDCVATACNAIYVQTRLDASEACPSCTSYGWQTPSVPVTVDLTQPPFNLPSDAKAAFLTGMLLITHGTTSEVADIHLTAAADGEPIDCTKYLGQTVEQTNSGQRSNAAFWVPLTNGKFKFCYVLPSSVTASWPVGSSYGINFSLQMWGR